MIDEQTRILEFFFYLWKDTVQLIFLAWTICLQISWLCTCPLSVRKWRPDSKMWKKSSKRRTDQKSGKMFINSVKFCKKHIQTSFQMRRHFLYQISVKTYVNKIRLFCKVHKVSKIQQWLLSKENKKQTLVNLVI